MVLPVLELLRLQQLAFGFLGVNDHEADWEMVSVYLYRQPGRLGPGLGRLRVA